MDEIKNGVVVESKRRQIKDIPDSFFFHLRNPVRFSHGGSGVEIDKIEICAPSVGMLIKKFKIEQMVSQAILRASGLLHRPDDLSEQALLEEKRKKEVEEDEYSPIKAGETARYLILLSELSLEAAISLFGELAIANPESKQNGCVQINGQNLNFIQWHDIREDDKMDIFFQFVGVFILPSVFSPREKDLGA